MKIILLFLILCVGLKAQNAYYALVDSNNVVFEVFMANPTIIIAKINMYETIMTRMGGVGLLGVTTEWEAIQVE